MYDKFLKLWVAAKLRLELLHKDECGASAVEYALLASLIGAVIVAGASLLGGGIDTTLQGVANTINPPATP